MSESTEEFCVILTTCATPEDADALAQQLVAERLAACVQVTGITSYYRWKNETCKDPETLLLIKTRAELYDQVELFISKNHSYEVPEIVQLPITAGAASYFGWIRNETRNP